MGSKSPKRFRTRILDRLGFGSRSSTTSQASVLPSTPIPIFETSLLEATTASRLLRTFPAPSEASTHVASAEDLELLYRFWCPAIVVRCLEFLNSRGLDEEGIYRVPGSSETIKRLKLEFNCRGDVNFDQLHLPETSHSLQIADVASLFKLYLRELPSPIIPPLIVKDLEGVAQIITSLRDILSSKLQPYEFFLLSIFCMHLSAIDEHSSTNKMDINNLSIVFCSSSNLGIGSNLFTLLARRSVWEGLRCANEQSALEAEKAVQA